MNVHIRINAPETGKRIKELRKERGIPTADLCEALDVSAMTYYKWIRGETIPTIDHLVMLSALLGTTIDAIVAVERITSVEKRRRKTWDYMISICTSALTPLSQVKRLSRSEFRRA